MTPEELLLKLEEIKAAYGIKLHRAAFTFSERKLIEKYYYLVMGSVFRKGNCSSCYSDAFTNIYLTLKKKKTFMKQESEFVLRRGVVLATPGVSSVLSGRDVPSDQALEHLAKFPAKIRLFEVFPDDWKTRVDKILNPDTKINVKDEINNEFSEEEKGLITLIMHALVMGELKADIKQKYKNSIIDEKPITVRELNKLIKKAESILESEQ